MALDNPKPTEIRLGKDKATLTVTFDNDEAYSYPAEFLRVVSPSAEASRRRHRTVCGGPPAVIELFSNKF